MMWTGHWLPILANYSQFVSGFAILGAVGTFWHHVNCHATGCKRIGHPVQGTSFRACKPHHPHLQGDITPARMGFDQ